MSKIVDAIGLRWSPYSFSDKSISADDIESLFKAASMAPSSYNEQPWLFSYATSDNIEKFEAYSSIMVESNRVWASKAHMLVVSLARRFSSYSGKPNKYALHDTGMATANLLAQATHLGLSCHIMGGFSESRARQILNLEDDVEVVAVIAVGYKGENSSLPEDILLKDIARRPRKPLNEIVLG